MGIKIILNHKVEDIMKEKKDGNFDAVYLSIGAELIKKENFQKDDSVYISDAFSFFKEMKTDPSPFEGKKVVVYGGGKLALYLSQNYKKIRLRSNGLFRRR